MAILEKIVAPYKGRLEVWFASHRTLGNYFKLIWLTVLAVIKPSSKKWQTAFKDLPSVPETLKTYIE